RLRSSALSPYTTLFRSDARVSPCRTRDAFSHDRASSISPPPLGVVFRRLAVLVDREPLHPNASPVVARGTGQRTAATRRGQECGDRKSTRLNSSHVKIS